MEINLPDMVGRGYGSFWRSKKRYRVLKGGRASKKSRTVALWYIYNIMKHPQANAVVVRNTFNTNKDSTYAVLKWAARRLEVFHLWKFTESPLEAKYLPTGQKILFRGFDDPLKITSITVDVGVLCWAWVEEAFEIEKEEEFRTFDESIRGEMPDGLWKQVTLSYNPWIDSHWTKSRFFDNTDPDADTYTTTYKCNEWLDDADRRLIEDLERTNPARYKVVGLGEYGLPGGTYFEEFSESVHVIQPFVIPDDWQRFRVLDYGLDMLAAYWIAVDMQGFAYVYKEVYESDHIISAAAKRLKEMTLPSERIKLTYAPPDLWNRRQDTGKSAAEIFQNNDVTLIKAGNERIQGWLNLKEWLAPYETFDEQTGEAKKTARIKFFSNCKNIIRTLPAVLKDEKDPNDVATEPHELTHGPDAIRYFCGMRTLPSKPSGAPRHPTKEEQVQQHIDKLDKQARSKRKRKGEYAG
ncbi:PBSX family phage terminase large subunit [Paenibacillus lycopersici]|uniref:PBSX family phage terminase large subunit n=1 Tax=Paenibacillus lycopersici TaxID=2704462 RepID=A0A6C0FYF7_9BACL|nr:PBSX family phage terminase large subunit [Paenibacillus lycopersici]QHT61707.1 PBSX family phage terminase large subunit [Paenibacillus lycopersici]